MKGRKSRMKIGTKEYIEWAARIIDSSKQCVWNAGVQVEGWGEGEGKERWRVCSKQRECRKSDQDRRKKKKKKSERRKE